LLDGRPDPKRMGKTFRSWLSKLTSLGYAIEFRSLVAADYGTPTTRRRLFLIARRDGGPLVWPDPTHGKGRAPWRSAAKIIDWRLPCPSIFDRARPLAEATMRRIAVGIQRYVIGSAEPFIVPLTHQGGARVHAINEPVRTITAAHRGELALVCPTVISHYGRSVGRDLREPLATVTAGGHHALTAAFLTKFYGTSTGAPMSDPTPTVTGGGGRGGGHLAEVRAFLIKYHGGDRHQAQRALALDEPMRTVDTSNRFGLVLVAGKPYQIIDIGMRMLQSHELFAAQGFPDDYIIAPDFNGKPLTKTAQISLAGNSVCPQVAEAIVAANAKVA